MTASPDSPMQETRLIPAASLIVLRQGEAHGLPEVLMVERAGHLRFAGGASVFPGGRVDACDGQPDDDHTARLAAVRETLEETGLLLGGGQSVTPSQAQAMRDALKSGGNMAALLAENGWKLDPAALTFFAHWRQPQLPGNTVGRFDTCFFLANAGSGHAIPSPDLTECTRAFWITPQAALAPESGLRLIFVTRCILARLAQYQSHAQACADALAHPIPAITPQLQSREGEPWLTIPDGLGYPLAAQPLQEAHRG